MELPKVTGFLWFYLGLLLAFGQVLTVHGQGDKAEWELPAEPELPKEGLQIKLDRDLYKKQGSIVYTSRLQFDKKPEISDSQLFKIARDAFKEMRGSAAKNGLTEKIPNVMTTLLIGNELIFASSAKGPEDPYKTGDQVKDELKICSDANQKRRHANGGRCGEVMAFHEWYQAHEGSPRLDKDSGAKIVAISLQTNAAGKGEPLILRPCGNDKNWGCNVFINGVYALDNDKVAADPEKKAFQYIKMLKDGTLKPAPPRAAKPSGPPPNKLAPPPGSEPNDKPSGSRPGPPPNKLKPPPQNQNQNQRPSGGKPGPPPNKLTPPPGRPNPRPGDESNKNPPTPGGRPNPGPGGSDKTNPKPPKNNNRPPKGPGKPKRP